MILGIDVSTYLEQQSLTHQLYYKDDKVIDPFLTFKNQGVTHIRTRIWNHPYNEKHEPYLGGTCDINNFLNLYEFLKKYDFTYVVDFHLSDFWTDPSKQFLPKAWKDLPFEQLLDEIYLFCKDSMRKIKEKDIPVSHIQIGNEITNGILFPHGKIDWNGDKDASFAKVSLILNAGIKGVKEYYPEAKIIVHLERSFDQETYREYVNQLRKHHVAFDIIGSSYYPFWHRGFNEYFSNMDMLINELGVKAMNCELGYPWTLEDYRKDLDGDKHLVINDDNTEELKKYLPYEISSKGQKEFLRDFIKLSKEHHLEGVFYWEPLWVPGEGVCWASKDAIKYQHEKDKDTRNEWANQTLFDYSANALPALDEYKL